MERVQLLAASSSRRFPLRHLAAPALQLFVFVIVSALIYVAGTSVAVGLAIGVAYGAYWTARDHRSAAEYVATWPATVDRSTRVAFIAARGVGRITYVIGAWLIAVAIVDAAG